MEGQTELTCKAAARLIKSRMRCFIYSQGGQDTPWLEGALPFESTITNEAEQEWLKVLPLWDLTNPEIRGGLVEHIREALSIAVEDTEALLQDVVPQLKPLISAYCQTFNAEALLSGAS